MHLSFGREHNYPKSVDVLSAEVTHDLMVVSRRLNKIGNPNVIQQRASVFQKMTAERKELSEW